MKSACVAARLLKQYPVTEENAGPVQLLMRGGGNLCLSALNFKHTNFPAGEDHRILG